MIDFAHNLPTAQNLSNLPYISTLLNMILSVGFRGPYVQTQILKRGTKEEMNPYQKTEIPPRTQQY